MHGCIICEFGMEGRGKDVALLNESRFAGIFGEDVDSGAHALDNGSADENHFHRFGFELGGSEKNVAGELAAISIAQNSHVQKAQRRLWRIGDVCGKENCASAGAEDGRIVRGEFFDGFEETFFHEELQLGGAFPAGKDKSMSLL